MYELTNTYLKKCRLKSGVSQVQAAKIMGYSSQFIANTERFCSLLPLEKLKLYIQIIGADKNKLIKFLLKDKENEYRKFL